MRPWIAVTLTAAVWITVALSAAGCGGDPSGPDATIDAGPRCTPTAEFGTAELLTVLSSDLDDVSARLRPDELEIVFARRATAGYDLWTAGRTSRDEPFGAPSLLTTVNSVNSEVWPTLSPDGQLLMFDADRSTPGSFRIWSSERSSTVQPFGPPSPRTDLMIGDSHPLLANATTIYFASAARGGLGGGEIFRADVDAGGVVGTPVALVGDVNTADDEVTPAITSDERAIFFRRTDALAESDIYTASRSTPSDGFGASSIVPVSLPGVDEAPTWVSPDGCYLYFHSNVAIAGGPAGFNLFVTRRGG